MTEPSATDKPHGEPIAIIGMGCMFPDASELKGYWANVRDGHDAISEIPPGYWSVDDDFDEDPSATDMTCGRRGGFLGPCDFNPLEFGIAPKDIQSTDTTQLLGMVVAKRALNNAGYGVDGRSFDRGRTSVILGVTGALELVVSMGARLGHPIWRRALRGAGVDDNTAEEVVERIREAYPQWQEASFPGLLGNVVAGRIANTLDLHGTNCVVDAACGSSMAAIYHAVLELEAGRSDMVLTGGLDTFNDIFMYMCFSKTPALSKTGNAKPFSSDGDGTILGESLGVVVLKRLADAERDGDDIRSVIRGIGASSDGKGNVPLEGTGVRSEALSAELPVGNSLSQPKVVSVERRSMEYSALGKTDEPAMTRWVANNLSTAHWFDISAARRDLGYEPSGDP